MSVLVTKQAPDFTATAVMGDNSFKEDFSLSDYKGKYVVLYFYPLDFTFVCPSEIIAFDHRLKEFEDRGVQVIGVSVDSHFTHLAWKNTPVNNGGIGQIRYPLVADLTKEIAADYGVLINNTTAEDDCGDQFHLLGGSVALRGSFLIDKEGVVRHQVVNDLPLGRNIDEMLRMVDALQFHEEHGEVCPAGWDKSKKGMAASTEGVAAYLAAEAEKL
ncbi:MAG: peroxidase [Zetaproteobacteria bacterium CG06_land_8_20_14_3_00_59_53]|nr:MAG: peroxidase [Zetaproteobacteria bacterium CG2_30_59_37]PIO89387.1 MAG: peroxidase [Zetaproteobacteria bacterium CG23_combo_of_CG06-09_8_20_14_all_59_86]PIQ65667.1 MAG: peroxidase [Zetaproteobacteria bacterium CG11_big_fil_rev_8_21_14_0_20_59_439]PIU70684.1 MAG: peroxidase [Zetaproteobacteria bacterium CG06_land_8_20_14_3_00_59_53]PIU98046.1 MAG: peroxidase [Zetaproteobacteria bacterium CG03_land_8_20_14_0_80_59_51]PIY47882.1 MAG: peroxidase [Zetaproteobacteria bacterium CG_4_10_14_0_8_u